MLVAITCESHGGGEYSVPFSVKEVSSFEEAFRSEVKECVHKNDFLDKNGSLAGWNAEPYEGRDGTGDIYINYCGTLQYLIQVRRVG